MDFTEKMKDDILTQAREYIDAETDAVFKDEVEAAIEMEDWEGLYDRFYTSLAFGTAGMRGVIGGGTNRINTYMVRKVSQGLAQYLLSAVSGSGGCNEKRNTAHGWWAVKGSCATESTSIG